jgi:hypothetical protein
MTINSHKRGYRFELDERTVFYDLDADQSGVVRWVLITEGDSE